MRSLNILRQGLWASITGGWFYDPHHGLFCNTFHFYSWISLVLLPFLVHLWSKSAWYPWFIYFGLILTAFSLIKVVNLKLHLMFDTSEAIEEQDVDKHRQKKGNSSSDFEDIELQVLNVKEENPSSPVPVTTLHSHHTENDQTIISRSLTVDASIHGAESDVKVEVHRKNSISSDPATLVLDVHCEKLADLSAVASLTSKNAGELYSGNDSMSPPAMTSLKSIESEDVEETQRVQRNCLRPSTSGIPGGRRFSNISNLAFGLSSTTTSAPRLQGSGGSLELGFVLEDNINQTIKHTSRPTGGLSVRRTLSALETSTDSPCDPSSTASSAPQNVGAVNYPTHDEHSEVRQQANLQIESQQKSCVAEQFLVDVKTDNLNVSCADEDNWTSFFTSAPFQPFVSSNSQIPICDLSQPQCPRNGKTPTDSNLAQDSTNELDITTLHSSSSSTAESAENEATRLLLPLPPRLLPFSTRTVSTTNCTYLTECLTQAGNASSGLGVIPKRRQRSGASQIDEESEEDELVITSPSGLCNDELNQFTPPKRRKLAARRRRHPAGDPTNSVVMCKRDVVEDDFASGQQKNINSYQNRNRRQWRPRRRRRTNVPISTSSTSSDARDNFFSSVDQCQSAQELELSASFVVPSTSFPWFVSGTAEGSCGPTQTIVTNTSTPSALNISSTTRTTRLSLSSNPAALNNSSISLSSALTVSLPEPESQLVHFRRRETERTERLRVRATRDRDRHNNSTTTSNPTAVDAVDYFGSSTLQTLLHNLHTGRSPLQFISASNLGSVGSASGGGTSSERERERHSIVRHPFALPLDSMNEVLGRVNNVANNNHSEARFRTDQGSEDEQQSPPILSLTKPRRFYRFYFWPGRPDVGSRPGSIKIRFDRLALLALLDRNISSWDSALCVILALAVSILTALVLRSGLLQDAYAFLFCLVCAASQYSLLKSVQPDASSPTHGHNRLVAFSRSVYFILLVSLLLLVNYSCQQEDNLTEQKLTSSLPSSHVHVLSLYGLEWGNFDQLKLTRDLLVYLVLCFPVIFSLGLLPQISTFTIYLLEQIEINVFSGTAVTGLSSAVYAIFRSCFLVVLVYGPAYAGLKEPATSQHILFSAYCGLLVASCYHVSRCSADPSVLCSWVLQLANSKQSKTTTNPKTSTKNEDGSEVFNKTSSKDEHNGNNETKNVQRSKEDNAKEVEVEDDPLPRRMRETVVARLRSDAIICPMVAVLVFGVHCSTVFTTSQLQPVLGDVLWIFSSVLGFILHYIIPQMRKSLPWLCFSRPLMRSHEHDQFEVHQPAKLMWFERIFLWSSVVERHVLLPVFFLDVMTRDSPILVTKFGLPVGVLLAVVCGTKGIRASMTNPSSQYLIITFAKLLFGKDLASTGFSETFLVDYFIISVLLAKTTELFLKVQFIITYIAPWQITWGSAFHAFAQPFSCPHSAMLFCQAIISSLLSAPLSPFLGSAIFFTSYPRPVKFWERDYKTRRVDASNTRLASQLEPMRSPGGDDNNLNSIFYEHLTRSLQQSLAGDLMLGRWGPIAQGDCYVLASENLNCLVHIVECGNSLVTFQVRGLEFRGTYCQQREVEAISEGVEEDDSCCCCEPGHLPYMLGGNAAFNQRWLAWQVMATKYVLEGYSISDNNASTMLHVFDLRRILVTYYIKSVIYYTTRSPLLEDWLANPSIVQALQGMSTDRSFADLDPVFNINIDEDYDYHVPGITRSSFCSVYLNWIQYCANRREKSVDSGRESMLVSLCLALSLLGRRALGSAAHTALSSVEFFLFGLHALFKGDFRITSFRDEWVFNDMELLRRVVAPAIRMSLKLHQDHFACPDEYEDSAVLYEAIGGHEAKLVISHEGDPAWRRAVLAGVPSLLALRHVVDDNSDEYKIIMLNKRFLSFRVIKLNRECVRGLWAGQQQELVYLRNRNQERGSIQNAKQVLRNIINSSCDQPIGYPIYVSPLMTSFAETHPQIRNTLGGGPISVQAIRSAALLFFRRLRARCGAGCSSGGSGGAQCPDVEVSLENLRSNLMANNVSTPGPTGSLANLANIVGAQSNRALFNPPFGSFTGSSSGLGPNALTLTNYTTSTLSAASGGLTSFNFNTTRGSSPRSSLGASTQRGSIASTMSATLRKPSGSTLISLAGMLAERDSAAAAISLAASPSSSAQAIANASINSTVSVFRERRSSRGSESQDRDWDRDLRLRGALSESSGVYGGPIRQRSSSSRNGEEERRNGARERNRRRERDRRESRLDRLESLDNDRVLPETEPFVDSLRVRINERVKIIDPNQIYDTINLGRRIDVLWPSSGIREKGGKNYWRSWLPEVGDEGVVVHIWTPHHPDTRQRSHVDRVILLLQIEDKYVPISETAVEVIRDHAP